MIRNIVFFIQNFSRSAGSERVTSVVANMLSREGYNVTVLSICGNNTCFYEIDKKVRLVTLFDEPEINNRKSFFKVKRKLSSFYAANKTDLVIDVCAALCIYTLLLKRKFRYKNITWEHLNFTVKSGMNKFGRKYAARKSDCIVTLTEQDKSFYTEAFPRMRAKIYAVYNPSPYYCRENTDNRENIIISVGRVDYLKGFDRLIDVWQIIQERIPDWKILVFGEGDKKEFLQEELKRRNIKNFEFRPATRNIDEWYKKSKIYVSTSRTEGLPMTMIEAQTFGLPIISYNFITGPKDIISDGKSGFIIREEDSEAFGKAVLKLTEDENERLRMSENAYIESKRFSVGKICEKWSKIISEL